MKVNYSYLEQWLNGTEELKPCPCCGSTNIYVGPSSADGDMVACKECGIRMIRELPDRWSKNQMNLIKGLQKQLIAMDTEQVYDENDQWYAATRWYLSSVAVDAWNKRVSS